METLERIAEQLNGYTRRCIISLVDIYRKNTGRLRKLEKNGVKVVEPADEEVNRLKRHIADVGATNGMEARTCAEEQGDCSQAILLTLSFRIERIRPKSGREL